MPELREQLTASLQAPALDPPPIGQLHRRIQVRRRRRIVARSGLALTLSGALAAVLLLTVGSETQPPTQVQIIGQPASAPGWHMLQPFGTQVSNVGNGQTFDDTDRPPQTQGVMAYDPVSHQLVAFGGGRGASGGGRSSADPTNQTWLWDGRHWVEQDLSVNPPARIGGALAYDAVTRRLILFGGAGIGVEYNDTWAWDGRRWMQLHPATSPAVPGLLASMAPDPNSGRLLLFMLPGPYNTDPNRPPPSQTWLWTGDDWQLQHPANNPAIVGPGIASDPATKQVILFGGYLNQAYSNEIWAWNGTNWLPLVPARAPSPRTGATMAFDPDIGGVLMFGGSVQTPQALTVYDDTWIWNGHGWQPWSGPAPAGRSDYSMAYDPQEHGVVLYGGAPAPTNPDYYSRSPAVTTSSGSWLFSDTWVWRGKGLTT